jgi:hypothetical protein
MVCGSRLSANVVSHFYARTSGSSSYLCSYFVGAVELGVGSYYQPRTIKFWGPTKRITPLINATHYMHVNRRAFVLVESCLPQKTDLLANSHTPTLTL